MVKLYVNWKRKAIGYRGSLREELLPPSLPWATWLLSQHLHFPLHVFSDCHSTNWPPLTMYHLCFLTSLFWSLQLTIALHFCFMASFYILLPLLSSSVFSNLGSQERACAWPRSSFIAKLFLARPLLPYRLPALRSGIHSHLHICSLRVVGVIIWFKTWQSWQKCLWLRNLSLQRRYPHNKHLSFGLSNKQCMDFSLDSNSLSCTSSAFYKLIFRI